MFQQETQTNTFTLPPSFLVSPIGWCSFHEGFKLLIFNHNIRVCNFYCTRLLQSLGLSTHNILVPCDLVLALKLRSQHTQSNWCHNREQGLKTSYQCKNSSIILNNVTFFLQDESLVIECHSFLWLLSLIMSETEKKHLERKCGSLSQVPSIWNKRNLRWRRWRRLWILRNSRGLPFGTRNTMKEKTMGMKKQKTKGSNLRSKLLHRNDLGIPKEEKHILTSKQKGSRQIKWSCKFNHLVNIFLGTRSIDQRKIWEDK